MILNIFFVSLSSFCDSADSFDDCWEFSTSWLFTDCDESEWSIKYSSCNEIGFISSSCLFTGSSSCDAPDRVIMYSLYGPACPPFGAESRYCQNSVNLYSADLSGDVGKFCLVLKAPSFSILVSVKFDILLV